MQYSTAKQGLQCSSENGNLTSDLEFIVLVQANMTVLTTDMLQYQKKKKKTSPVNVAAQGKVYSNREMPAWLDMP